MTPAERETLGGACLRKPGTDENCELDRAHVVRKKAEPARPGLAAGPGGGTMSSRPQLPSKGGDMTVLGRYRYVVDNLAPGTAPGNAPGTEAGESGAHDASEPEVRLWLALPLDRAGQGVVIERVDPQPFEIVEDRVDGNRIAVWRVAPPGSGAPLRFTVDFAIDVSTVETVVDPNRVLPVDAEAEVVRRNLRAEPWLERTPEIERLARALAWDGAGPWEFVVRAFDWVRSGLRYAYPEVEQRGAEKALARLSGDCGDFAHLFLALCRARGVPGRAVTACWMTGAGHQWAEVLIPPYGWLPVDPSIAHAVATRAPVFGGVEGTERLIRDSGLPTDDPRWLCGNLYPNRVMVSVGTNIAFRSRDHALDRTFVFLQPGGGNAWPPALEVDGVGGRPVHGGFFLFHDGARDEAAAESMTARALAQGWLEAGDLERAEAGVRLSLAEAPEASLHWFTLGQIEQARGAWRAAGDAYAKVLAGRGGSLKHVLEAWARVFRGMCFDALGQRDLAIAEYDAAIATGVDHQGSLALARQFREAPFEP